MASKKKLATITNIQIKCLKCITPDYEEKFLLIGDLIKVELAKFGWKVTNHLLPIALQKCALTNQFGIKLSKSHQYATRNKGIPNLPHTHCKSYSTSIFCKGISYYYTLPMEIKQSPNYFSLCIKMKQFLLSTM